jgi:hypothetical protein
LSISTPVQRRAHPCHWFHRKLQIWGNPQWWAWIFPVLNFFITANLWVMGTAFVLLKFADPKDQQLGPLQPLLEWVYDRRFLVASILLALQPGLHLLRWFLKKLVSQSVDVGKVEEALNNVVLRLFEAQDLDNHHYRATLFRVRHVYGVGRWLGAVARSGHTYRRLTTVFSIDPEKRENNTGFAGECWRQGGRTLISPTPLPDQRSGAVSAADRERYKTEGYLADVEYDKMSLHSRVFLATGVKVGGFVWGVLVIDSTDPNALPAILTTTTGTATAAARRRREILEQAAEHLRSLVQ